MSGLPRATTIGQIIKQEALRKPRQRPAPISLHPPILIESLTSPQPSPRTPANSPQPSPSAIPATPYTQDRSRRFKSLIKAQPLLPIVISHTISQFQTYVGTRDRSADMKIFLYLSESFTEDDPILKQRLVDLALDEVAVALKIDRCIVEASQKAVRRCCRDRFACCFPCLSS